VKRNLQASIFTRLFFSTQRLANNSINAPAQTWKMPTIKDAITFPYDPSF